MNPAYIAIIVIFIVLFVQRHNNTVWIKQFIKAKRLEGNTQMLELAKSFIGKECMIYTITSQLSGVIKEVSGSAILLESGNTLEAVNLDFVVRIREHPRKKNGKKKAIVLD